MNIPHTEEQKLFHAEPWGLGYIMFLKLLKAKGWEMTDDAEYTGMYYEVECLCSNGHACYTDPWTLRKGHSKCDECP